MRTCIIIYVICLSAHAHRQGAEINDEQHDIWIRLKEGGKNDKPNSTRAKEEKYEKPKDRKKKWIKIVQLPLMNQIKHRQKSSSIYADAISEK